MDDAKPGRWHGLKDRAPGLHRFLTRDDKPFPVLREVLGGAVIILLLVSILWGVTGQPLNRSPVVVVESGSMMHCTNGNPPLGKDCEAKRFARIGTIDPGDLIFVRDIDDRHDVDTLAASGAHHYGKAGDVIVFRPDGSTVRTPVIHRALFWLQVNDDGTFSVPEFGISHADDLQDDRLLALGLRSGYAGDLRSHPRFGPELSGFITRGDNNAEGADQYHGSSVSFLPIQSDWILGKARGEGPWLGLAKLLMTDLFAGTSKYANAPGDCKLMLWVSLGALLGGPYVVEKLVQKRRAKKAERDSL